MRHLRWVTMTALGTLTAASLAVPALAPSAGTLASGSTVVTRHTQPFVFPQSVCDHLAQRTHTKPIRPCVGRKLSVTVIYKTKRPTAVVTLASTTEYGTWWALGGWPAGGSVTEDFTVSGGVVYHNYTNCDAYWVSGWSVSITWCGATGSGTGTLTSGENFTLNMPGSGLAGMGMRQTMTANYQTGIYCWRGPWVNC